MQAETQQAFWPASASVQEPAYEAPSPSYEEPKPAGALAGPNVMNVVLVGAECAPWSKTGNSLRYTSIQDCKESCSKEETCQCKYVTLL